MVAHWDDVAGRSRAVGHLLGTWSDLASAAGSITVGLQRIRLPPRGWSTPAHVHGRQEEIFWVLAGSGLSWQEGATYEIGPGDCVVHVARGAAHTVRAGDDGIDLLAFGPRDRDEAATLPRAGAAWFGRGWVVLADEKDHPWTREAAAGPPELPEEPSPRPPSIVNVDDVPEWVHDHTTVRSVWRDLGRSAGSRTTGLKEIVVRPGALSAPPHCHSAEEELFVVLAGTGTLELTPSPEARGDAETDDVPVRAGHVAARPAGTRVAHAFRAGEEGLRLLAYGTRDPADVAYYPRSNKLYFRGAGVIGRVEPLSYWDGEE